MRTIAFVTQKGGSGKSTLASSIAVAAKEAGEKVFVIDMDPLASLTTWSRTREAKDIAVESVPVAKLRAVLAALEKKGVTLVVIDTPGADDSVVTTAVKVSDLCIVPARPNAFDLWASENTRRMIKGAGRDYAFLLNQCPPAQQSARVELGMKTLEALGGLLTPLVSARVDFQEAARQGLGVTEVSPHGAASEEIRSLWTSIRRRLNKAVAARNIAAAAKPGASANAAGVKTAGKGAPTAKSVPARSEQAGNVQASAQTKSLQSKTEQLKSAQSKSPQSKIAPSKSAPSKSAPAAKARKAA